jgi:hypothetical protein
VAGAGLILGGTLLVAQAKSSSDSRQIAPLE